MPIWITVVVAVIGSAAFAKIVEAVIAALKARREAREAAKKPKEIPALTRLVLGVAHDKIISKLQGYITVGRISPEDLTELKSYYISPYFECGGDGTVSALWDVFNRDVKVCIDTPDTEKQHSGLLSDE